MQSVSSNAVANAISGTVLASISQVIDDAGTIAYGENYAVLGSYDYDLFDPQGITDPPNTHREYILSFQGTTSAGNKIRVRLNNIATDWCMTWSGSTFRKICCSARFKKSDIILEPTLTYGNSGTNLYYESSGGSSGDTGRIYNVTVTCLIVKD